MIGDNWSGGYLALATKYDLNPLICNYLDFCDLSSVEFERM